MLEYDSILRHYYNCLLVIFHFSALFKEMSLKMLKPVFGSMVKYYLEAQFKIMPQHCPNLNGDCCHIVDYRADIYI